MPRHFKRAVTLSVTLFFGIFLLTGCARGRVINENYDYSSGLTDGEYSATSRYYNHFGYKEKLTFWINKGIITRVNFSETSRDGQSRLDQNIRWTGCNFSYNEIIDKLYSDSILSQGESVDSISGATKTVSDYTTLQDSLMKAISEKTGEDIIVDSFDDTFIAVNEPDPVTGSQEQLTVVFRAGAIESVTIEEVTNNTAFYIMERSYKSLAQLSEQTHSLNNLTSTSVDPIILRRYNELLGQVRAMRE